MQTETSWVIASIWLVFLYSYFAFEWAKYGKGKLYTRPSERRRWLRWLWCTPVWPLYVAVGVLIWLYSGALWLSQSFWETWGPRK